MPRDNENNSEDSVNKSFSRRKFGALLATGAIGTAIGPLNVAGERSTEKYKDQTKEVQELYANLDDKHGGLKDIQFETINSNDNSFRQIFIYNDREKYPMLVEVDGNTEILTVGNKQYHAKIDQDRLRSSEVTDVRSDIDPFHSHELSEETAILDSEGDISIKASNHSQATGCQTNTSGGGVGQLENNCNKSDFRAEAAATGSGAFYGKSWVDVYPDMFVDEPSNQSFDLDVEWNNYVADFEMLCASGSARAICNGKIADIDANETLSTIEVADKNKTVAELRPYHKSGTKRGSAVVDGQTTYRIGIRAVAGVFTAGVSAATSDIKVNESRYEIESLSLSLSHLNN